MDNNFKNKTNMTRIEKAIAEINMMNLTAVMDKTISLSGGRAYKYASLSSIKDLLKPILKEYGILYYQDLVYQNSTSKESSILVTKFFIDGGDEISDVEEKRSVVPEKEFEFRIKFQEGMGTNTNYYQELGSAITYLKKYSLSTIFGIVISEDTDSTDIQPVVKKKVLKEGSDDYKAVLEYMSKGTTLDEVKTKFIVGNMVENSLLVDLKNK